MRAPLITLRNAALAAILGVLALAVPVLAMLALAVPAAGASEPSTTTPAVGAAPSETGSTGAGSGAPQTPSAPASTTPTATGPETGAEAGAGEPQVQGQHLQHTTRGGSASGGGGRSGKSKGAEGEAQGAGGTQPQAGARAGRRAPAPSGLTPALPLGLGSQVAGVSSFFVESFQVPPFLLPIYQAAGTAYGVPWQVLAAINEVETDYGRDLSVSSAGAEGWMQFLPSSWAQYGVDANGDGFKDPYNPADAIFAAARYLRAAGGGANIRAAVYSYNHSQAYVSSVMLRAQLLGGTPPELLGAITGLTEARFPVHAPAHFGDGFATVRASGSGRVQTLVGTTIYSQAGAPAIAVQDGEVVQIGDSPALGRFVSLRDAYGNTYTYARLGSVAALYPVLQPHDHTAVSARIAQPGGAVERPPSAPATAGAQPRSPLSAGAIVSGLALGATAALERPPAAQAPAPAPTAPPAAPRPRAGTASVFRSGPNDVYLHPLQVGVQVIAGTVLGRLGSGASGGASAGDVGGAGAAGQEPHMLFQIRPAGAGAPLIDPKPILDGWVALESTSTFRAKGENPFLATSPTAGQVLLESKGQLEQQVVRDASVHMRACERQDVPTGRVDRRVLAAIELLSVSGLKPTVSGLPCGTASPAREGNAPVGSQDAVKITAVNGVPIAGHQGQGSIADATVRKLLTLQGANRPRTIVSLQSYPGAGVAVAKPSARDYVYVAFGPLGGGGAHAAGAFASALTPGEWIRLIARLGEIPDPVVSGGPSPAAIADRPAVANAGGAEGGAGGHG
ncbi:MAG TPA: lytic murein transglycosylase [Solirubrobacteraceae bacterium]|nr:lytic murein transglycosylase [Solirubrobacteraceae bacterium]